MIIDLILDRRENDAYLAAGYTHLKDGITGELIPLAYNPRKFYSEVLAYGDIGDYISRAMDYGAENNVRDAICDYIIRNDYNPEICGYVRSVTWLRA